MQKRTFVIAASAFGLTAAALLVASVVRAAPPQWNDPTAPVQDQIQKLDDIQPGIGTVMIEYSTRFTDMYYCARGGNWDFAAYQMKEAKEIQEVGETTRPARAQALKDFEANFLTPLDTAIAAKDFKAFNTAYRAAIVGCNNCHTSQGFPYIQFVLPVKALTPASLKAPK